MFQIGQSIGDYAILQELGRGGYGRVYKVEHTLTGRREAMKVLAANNANMAEESERFLREIRLQASLSHPNIAVVHTAFWVNDDLALVCELLEGQSLRQLLEQLQPTPMQALDIASQVLTALSYAHARGIIHRDISPANIFLTVGGIVKIIDFGLAKAATDLSLTREGSPIGVAHYMSPEQIRGAQSIDARTDLYSCGVVLYELLTGKKPFEGDNAFTIMKAHTEEPPSSPAAMNAAVSSELSAIVLRALSKKPEERFQSADAFLQAIKHVESTTSGTSRQRFIKRPVLVAAVAVFTILVGGLINFATTQRSNALPQESFVPGPPPVSAPDSPVVIAPAADPPADAPKTRRRKASVPAAKITLVEPEARKDPSLAAPEVKPPNAVGKLGGVLKKINPFHKSGSAQPKENRAR